MTLANERQNELIELIDALCDGTIAPDQGGRLQELLLHDREAQWLYVQRLHLHGALLWDRQARTEFDLVRVMRDRAGRNTVASGEGGAESGEDSGIRFQDSVDAAAYAASAVHHPTFAAPEIPKSRNPQIPLPPSAIHHPPWIATAWHGTANFFSQEVPFAILVTTVIFAIAGLIGSQITYEHYTQFSSLPGFYAAGTRDNANVPATPAPEPKTPEPKIPEVAQITGMVDCEWLDNLAPMHHRIGIGHNNKFSLSKGLMEITYYSGAKVILQGPCTYAIDSASGGYLSIGKLTARVETKGAGGAGRGAGGAVASGQWSVASEGTGKASGTQAANQKSESQNQKSPNPQSLILNPLFSVRTPTAVVTDLGTEFAVEVDVGGNSQVQVLVGCIELTDSKGLHRMRLDAEGAPRAAVLKVGGDAPAIISPDSRKYVRQMPGPASLGSLRELIASRFDADDEGWKCTEDAASFRHRNAAGNPGGCIEAADDKPYATFYFVAPAKFHGDWSAALGGLLRFDVLPRYVGRAGGDWTLSGHPKVLLVGGGKSLAAELPVRPLPDQWNSFQVILGIQGGWRLLEQPDSPPATEDDIRAVLSDVREMRIRGEYIDGYDMARLDNVVLSVPSGAGADEKPHAVKPTRLSNDSTTQGGGP